MIAHRDLRLSSTLHGDRPNSCERGVAKVNPCRNRNAQIARDKYYFCVTSVTSARTGDPIPWFKLIRITNGLDHYTGGTVAERLWLTEARHYFLVRGNHALSLY